MKLELPVVALAALAAVSALAALGDRHTRESVVHSTDVPGAPAPALSAPCPPGTLPDEGVCLPVPAPASEPRREGAERIPRRPDRDADYARYALPLPLAKTASPHLDATGEARAPDGGGGASQWLGGIFLGASAGATVTAVALEGQVGPALVVYTGRLVGDTLVTLHTVRERGRDRTYLVVLGNLTHETVLGARAELAEGAPVGVTAALPLYLDVRLVRPGVDAWTLAPAALLDAEQSVPVDARNVLRRLP